MTETGRCLISIRTCLGLCLFYTLFFFQAAGAQTKLNLDNSCKSCSRISLDSANLKPRNIRVNQAGYRPQDSHKTAFVANPSTQTFTVVNAQTQTAAYSGALAPLGAFTGGGMELNGYFFSINKIYSLTRAPATENLFKADFSPLNTQGRYYVVCGGDTSATFWVHTRIYNQVFETALKFFGVNRCGDTHSWIHKACHLKDGSAIGKPGALAGGWHDCGDHFKVSETLGYSALLLNLTYAIWPEKAEDFYGKSYNDTLPFGTDGIPDILWEARVGVDFIYKLYQASKADGLIAKADMYHSVGVAGADHQYWDVPENQDVQPPSKGGPDRVVAAGIGSNTAGMYAASLAFFSVNWEIFNSDYAAKLKAAAIDIYDNIIAKKRNTGTAGLEGFYTGGGPTYDDEAMAALALWYATRDQRFRFDLIDNTALGANPLAPFNPGSFPAGLMAAKSYFDPGGWSTDYQNIHAFVMYAFCKLILPDAATAGAFGIQPATRDSLRADLIYNMKRYLRIVSKNGTPYEGSPDIYAESPYNLVWSNFKWGLNRYNMGVVNALFMYWDLSGEQVYFNLGIDNLSYNLGINPWDISFVMGIGDKNLQHPHNRAANPDGYNAGGLPYEYTKPLGAFMGGARPDETLLEDYNDYTISETCIDFSAQLVLPAQMLAEDLPPDHEGPQFRNVNVYPEDVKAVVTWTTDEISRDTLFLLDAPGGKLLGVYPAKGIQKNKSVTITGLTPSTAYYFYFRGMDARRNHTLDNYNGSYYTFTTTSGPLANAQITNVRVCNEDHESAQVTWWTLNGLYNSRVDYGKTTALGQTVDGDDSGVPTRFHLVTLDALEAATNYFFDVSSGAVTDNNGGKHYTFKTSEVFVDYTIAVKPVRDAGTKFYVAIANRESQAYTGVEMRFYFTSTDKALVDGMNIVSYDKQHCTVAGCMGKAPDLSFGSPVAVEGMPGHYYIPITINSTLGVAERIRFDINLRSKGPNGEDNTIPLSTFSNAWSFAPHTEPVPFSGIDLSKGGPNGAWVGDQMVENGEVTFKSTPYITAYYNGVHVYGYGPDYQTNMPAQHRTVFLALTSPVTSPVSELDLRRKSNLATIAGRAFSTPRGRIDFININGVNLPPSESARDSDSSMTFNRQVSLQKGTNVFDIVAWDDTNCAFSQVKLVINWDSAPPPQVAPPVANPGTGEFPQQVIVKLTTATAGAEIYYTLDNSPPVKGAAGTLKYDPSKPIELTKTTTLKAIGVKDGFRNSSVLTAVYTQNYPRVEMPTATPPSGEFAGEIKILLATTTSGAEIYYTLDGSEPKPGAGTTKKYTEAVSLRQTTTLKAVAVKKDMRESAMLNTTYIQTIPIVATPVATPSQDPVFVFESSKSKPGKVEVALTTATEGAVILYTVDGTDPATVAGGSTLVYAGKITVTKTMVIKAIAVKKDWLPSAVLAAKYEKESIFTPLQAWMIDGNGNGRGDSLFIRFDMPLSSLPDSLSPVFWPGAGEAPRKVEHLAASPESSPIQFASADKTVVLADFSDNEFKFGLTVNAAGALLTLPDNRAFSGRSLPIADSLGAVIIRAVKHPSNKQRYGVRKADGTTVIRFNPDTLAITLSEPITAGTESEPWLNLAVVYENCRESLEPAPLSLFQAPDIGADGLTWKMAVPYTVGGQGIHSGDCIALKRTGPYRDAAGNAPVQHPLEIEGRDDGADSRLHGAVMVPVLGDPFISDDQYGTARLSQDTLPILDESGNFLENRIAADASLWIPPPAMNADGSIGTQCVPGSDAANNLRKFPSNCLSAIVVYTNEPYTATIKIMGHLGKYINSSVQRFGYCGELENPERIQPAGLMSFLGWNQKDFAGHYVGSGVFIWKVNYRFQDGRTRTDIYKQGIARTGKPEPGCALQ